PQASTEDAPGRFVAYRQHVARLAIAVELVHRAGLRDGRTVVVLLVPVAVSVGLVIQLPTMAQIALDAEVLEVCLYVIEVIAVVRSEEHTSELQSLTNLV